MNLEFSQSEPVNDDPVLSETVGFTETALIDKFAGDILTCVSEKRPGGGIGNVSGHSNNLRRPLILNVW